MAKLKSRQRQIYEYIVSFTEENGYPPSVREIGEAVDLKSPSTVHFHMKHLEEAGIDVKDGVVIVSNGFHLTRAKMLAGRVGFENVSVLAAPSSHTPTRLKMYVREPLALVKSFLFDR